MGLFRKKHDPISEKAQALNDRIRSIESEIKRLEAEASAPQPRFRSSTLPRNYSLSGTPPKREEPAHEHFEDVDHTPLQSPEPQPKPEHQNEFGAKKDVWQKLKDSFKPPPTSNPKLVNYLAAGSIQGLRPLRYEKRVARNRFIFLVAVLLLVLWGILAVIFRRP